MGKPYHFDVGDEVECQFSCGHKSKNVEFDGKWFPATVREVNPLGPGHNIKLRNKIGIVYDDTRGKLIWRTATKVRPLRVRNAFRCDECRDTGILYDGKRDHERL